MSTVISVIPKLTSYRHSKSVTLDTRPDAASNSNIELGLGNH